MIELHRICSAEDSRVAELEKLYEEAFPEAERRDISQWKEMIVSCPRMHLNAVEEGGQLAGLLVYWDFGDFYYVEHLAVYARMRNRKIGQQVLAYIGENLSGVCLLEVEPPLTDLSVRRINYYRRNGYEVLDKTYMQPSYRPSGEELPLWIMGNDAGIEREKLQKYIDTIKQNVYFNVQPRN